MKNIMCYSIELTGIYLLLNNIIVTPAYASELRVSGDKLVGNESVSMNDDRESISSHN